MTLKNWMPSQIKNIKFVKFSSLFFFLPLNFARFLNLFFVFLCIKLNIFRTSSPPTSCYRLGLCPSTPSRSWWSWSLPALKIGRRSRSHVRKNQLIKDKIYLRQIWNWLKQRYWWPATVWQTRSWRSRVDFWSGRVRNSGLWDGARNRTTWNPWLVRTEVSRFIRVG